MATLVITSAQNEGRRIEVSRELVIGRENVDVEIDDAELSRRHVAVRPKDGGLEVEDLGSRNGTRVDGTRIDGPHADPPRGGAVRGHDGVRGRGAAGEAEDAGATRAHTPAQGTSSTRPRRARRARRPSRASGRRRAARGGSGARLRPLRPRDVQRDRPALRPLPGEHRAGDDARPPRGCGCRRCSRTPPCSGRRPGWFCTSRRGLRRRSTALGRRGGWAGRFRSVEKSSTSVS